MVSDSPVYSAPRTINYFDGWILIDSFRYGIAKHESKPSMVPVTEEQSKAVQKLAEFGTAVVTEAGELARYVGKILGTVTEDVVGIVLGEPLHYLRIVIAASLDKRVQDIHSSRNVQQRIPVSPSLAIPLIKAAYDESRPELQNLWARLIAAATDPARAGQVRQSFIPTLQRFDPLDARVLEALYAITGTASPSTREFLANTLGVPSDEIAISALNLAELKCVSWSPGNSFGSANFQLNVYGHALIRACF